jgi:hypothetical protein
MKRIVAIACLIIAAVLTISLSTYVAASSDDPSKDTPEQLMSLAKSATSPTNPGNKFFKALATDKNFASNIHATAKAGNKSGLSDLIGKRVGMKSSEVTIETLKTDAMFIVVFKVEGKTYTACLDTEGVGCRGGGAYLGLL